MLLAQNATPRSRTPTPQIESTSQELGDSPASASAGVHPATASPATSDGPGVRYDTAELTEDATPAAGASEHAADCGVFEVCLRHCDDVFNTPEDETADLSAALSDWSDVRHDTETDASGNLMLNGAETG